MVLTVMKSETYELIDGHVHLFRMEHMDLLFRDLDETGISKFCMLITGRDVSDPAGEQFRLARLLQQRRPGKVFVFGGLDFSGMFDRHASTPDIEFETQLDRLIDTGYDGLKLLCGKPNHRQSMSAPLDSEVLRPMLNKLEATGFPVLWHISDPPEFWSEQTVPPWAKKRGWWYPPGTPSKAQIDAEFANVLSRYPKLRLIWPHFGFLADHLETAAEMLDRYPNLMFDLAPGIEMYHHFTSQHERAKAFFVKYSNRIIFGSDIGMSCGWHPDRARFVLRFLESDESFDPPDDPCFQPDDRPKVQGLGLSREEIEAITCFNFVRMVGRSPRGLR
jgi:predicted TIM-barrel fold metal-dependent hydrolase